MSTVDIPGLDTEKLIALRRELHRHPEVSNEEEKTAERIHEFLESTDPDEIVTGLGGHGLAATYGGADSGPTILVRAELDGLPIEEKNDVEFRSQVEGKGHQCGHDAHMTMVAGLAQIYGRQKPDKGRVVLLYQPAEETGEGARRVMEDEKFARIEPDYAYALHNLPGFPKGQIVVKSGIFASASRGLIVELTGDSTHASHPKDGQNPALAAGQIVAALLSLPTMETALHHGAAITPVAINVGQRAFGTSASSGTVMFTLRSHRNEDMERLGKSASRMAEKIAAAYDLEVETSWSDIFEAVDNNPDCMKVVSEIAEELGFDQRELKRPFPWSEDFGVITTQYPGGLFGLGSGEEQPQLHHNRFLFPDEILPVGTRMFHALCEHHLGG